MGATYSSQMDASPASIGGALELIQRGWMRYDAEVGRLKSENQTLRARVSELEEELAAHRRAEATLLARTRDLEGTLAKFQGPAPSRLPPDLVESFRATIQSTRERLGEKFESATRPLKQVRFAEEPEGRERSHTPHEHSETPEPHGAREPTPDVPSDDFRLSSPEASTPPAVGDSESSTQSSTYSYSDDAGQVIQFDAASFVELSVCFRLRGHLGPVRSVLRVPATSGAIASGGEDNLIWLWDKPLVGSGDVSPNVCLIGHRAPVAALAGFPVESLGPILFSGDLRGEVRGWLPPDVLPPPYAKQRRASKYEWWALTLPGAVWGLHALPPDSEVGMSMLRLPCIVAVGAGFVATLEPYESNDSDVPIYRVRKTSGMAALGEFHPAASCAMLGFPGVVVGLRSGVVALINTHTLEPIAQLALESGFPTCIRPHPFKDSFLCTTSEGELIVLACAFHPDKDPSLVVKSATPVFPGAAVALAISPQGTMIATASFNRAVRIWSADMKMLQESLLSFTGRKGAVHALDWLGDQSLISGGSDGTLEILE
eukprot:gnl/Chilomastix_cuspidata/916.p1 GENE.gnl/Chilomastix_cuspidata/916~~gnl/Chilomastix_cuspidata/916.p1  ORF type:complete len:545 (-),score=265.00 gnl/Chilomastix_cuspidata/916:97-1731(-)